MKIEQLLKFIRSLLPFLENKGEVENKLNLIEANMTKKETPQEALLRISKECIGKDVSPLDQAPDELGCAESLANILHSLDKSINPQIISTTKLYKALLANPNYEATLDLEGGNILISPTGYSSDPRLIPNGHCGIFDENLDIMSNDSASGTWQKNYTLQTWINRYRIKGKYPLYVFKKIV